MDDFFSIVSKGVIIVPIVIFILALVFKFNQTENQSVIPNYQVSPTITPVPTYSIKLDLVGPWECKYENKNKKYKLNVKDKKITLEITENGEVKKQDLSSYSVLLENFIGLDRNVLENMVKPYLPEGVDLKTLIESCKKI